MKSFSLITLLSCLLTMFIFSDWAMGQLRQRRNADRPNSSSAMLDKADEIAFRLSEIMSQYVVAETSKRYDLSALEETVKISNQSGTKLVADFYATSDNKNVALSPPTMLATFAALTHLAKGKTKDELQKLLSLNGTEKTAFGNLENYLIQSYRYYPSVEELALKESVQNAKQSGDWKKAVELQDQAEQQTPQLLNKKLGNQQANEYQRLAKELEELQGRLEAFNDPTGMPLSGSVPYGVLGTETYNSTGYLLFNRLYSNINEATQNEYLKQFGTKVEATDFSQEGLKKYNDEINNIIGDWGGEGEGVIQANGGQCIVACSAMILNFQWGFIMDQEERPFNFDTGRKNFRFLKGDLNVQNITVNDKIGYSFPIGLTNMILVKCRNGADLKQLAKTIASEGIKMESAGIRLRNVGLYLPYVGFQTKFNFIHYAQNKGLSIPFTGGQAEYALSDDIPIPYPCNDARVESLFQVDETGVLLKQITIAGIPSPIARNQRIPDRIIIDSPYLMIFADRNLGTILGMAFIANPVFEDGALGI